MQIQNNLRILLMKMTAFDLRWEGVHTPVGHTLTLELDIKEFLQTHPPLLDQIPRAGRHEIWPHSAHVAVRPVYEDFEVELVDIGDVNTSVVIASIFALNERGFASIYTYIYIYICIYIYI